MKDFHWVKFILFRSLWVLLCSSFSSAKADCLEDLKIVFREFSPSPSAYQKSLNRVAAWYGIEAQEFERRIHAVVQKTAHAVEEKIRLTLKNNSDLGNPDDDEEFVSFAVFDQVSRGLLGLHSLGDFFSQIARNGGDDLRPFQRLIDSISDPFRGISDKSAWQESKFSFFDKGHVQLYLEKLLAFADLPSNLDRFRGPDILRSVIQFGSKFTTEEIAKIVAHLKKHKNDPFFFEFVDVDGPFSWGGTNPLAGFSWMGNFKEVQLWNRIVKKAGIKAKLEKFGFIFPPSLSKTKLKSHMDNPKNVKVEGDKYIQVNGLENPYLNQVGKSLGESGFPLQVVHRTSSRAGSDAALAMNFYPSMGQGTLMGGHATWGEGVYAGVSLDLFHYGPFALIFHLNPAAIIGRDIDIFVGKLDGLIVVIKTKSAILRTQTLASIYAQPKDSEPALNHLKWFCELKEDLSVQQQIDFVYGVLQKIISGQVKMGPFGIATLRRILEAEHLPDEEIWREALVASAQNTENASALLRYLEKFLDPIEIALKDLPFVDRPEVFRVLEQQIQFFSINDNIWFVKKTGIMTSPFISDQISLFLEAQKRVNDSGNLGIPKIAQRFQDDLTRRTQSLVEHLKTWLIQVSDRGDTTEIKRVLEYVAKVEKTNRGLFKRLEKETSVPLGVLISKLVLAASL